MIQRSDGEKFFRLGAGEAINVGECQVRIVRIREGKASVQVVPKLPEISLANQAEIDERRENGSI